MAGMILAAVLVGASAVAPGGAGGNFSQLPGFGEYYAANPPGDALPDEEDRALLERFKPRFFLPDGHAGLISFYDDYVSHGVLKAADGEIISDAVTPQLLNRHKADPGVVFEHLQGETVAGRAVVFGRVDREAVPLAPEARSDMTFLTYHAVFRHSGLAQGMIGWQILLAGLFGDLDDWHQLDHYTAVTVVLDHTNEPVALLLQQHNNQRTYLLGEGYMLPKDGRPAVDVAIRSNELYPHAPGRRRHRAVRFPGRDEMKYLLGLGGRPFISADDITDPKREEPYELRVLPPSDAFYTFEGDLGARRLMPGRNGPPGANYNTWPTLKPLGRQLIAGYWRPGNTGDGRRLLAALKRDDWMMDLISRQAGVFSANWACAKRWGTDCAFE